jgi:hypothetical protein
MKTLLVFVVVGFVALVIVLAVRKQRSEGVRRRFPGPDLRRRSRSSRADNSRYDPNDSSFITTAAITGSGTQHDPGSHHGHGTDCAPSHDAGASCGSDGGGGGGADGGSN